MGELARTAHQQEIFDDMADVTRQVALAGVEKLKAAAKISLTVFYDLGLLVDQVLENDDLNDHQRKSEVKKLAAYWGQPNINLTTLYDMRNVATAFDRQFVQDQATEPMANGTYLTWTHFVQLQKVESKKQLAYLKKIRQNSWSANELALELQGKKDAVIHREGGRKPTIPSSVDAKLYKLFTSLQHVDNYVLQVADPLEADLADLPPAKINDRFLENLENTRARMLVMQEHLNSMQPKLDAAISRAKRVLGGEAKPAVQPDLEEDVFDEGPPQIQPDIVVAAKKRQLPRRSKA
jgi:hypothetical protein